MIISRLDLSSFRNFSQTSLSLSPKLNLFVGKNGSGKSSLIEAFYFLGFGRSFRTNKLNSVVQNDTDKFSLFAVAQEKDSSEIDMKVGVSRSVSGDFVCQIDGNRGKRLSELVSHFPIQLFTPQSTDLIIGTPKDRRKFLDWGVFHVEHSFRMITRQYSQVLKHRNALLKNDKTNPAEFTVWDRRLIEFGMGLTEFRKCYLDTLKPVFDSVLKEFLPEFEIQIEYNQGWNREKDFETALVSKFQYDGLTGTTSVGPHKADLKFKIGRLDASEVLSRGQLRMAVAAMQLAQTMTYNSQTNNTSIFLLDDLGAELDENKRELFLDKLVSTQAQVLVTAIDFDQLKFTKKYDNKKMFHVEHGSVKEE